MEKTIRRKAVCPGSFDPVTNGHIDIIERAIALFDEIVVLISDNPDKRYAFTLQERINAVTAATSGFSGVRVETLSGLLADYMKTSGASAVIRGLRATSDFEYEFQMALTNRKLNAGHETVFLSAALHNTYLSSSMVKQICSLGGDISSFVPPSVLNMIQDKLAK
ncbi:MAG: pantetheine-phosphate adenylyltransferase [Oscillospiraceae bacterium]|nr:pantetheine-phosphate adenylyltransferase [Oscillospiraceae bacterium]